jgi:Mg2+ and Co2+ transporter CorA
MIWIYTIKGKDFIATDVSSLSQLINVAKDQWAWVDIFHPNEKELGIITELLGKEPDIVEKFKKMMEEPLNIHNKGCVLCNYERIHEYVSVTIPYLSWGKQMLVYPIVLAKKKRMIITWGEEGYSHSKIIKTTIRRLREGVEAGQNLNSSLVISVLFHEIAIRNVNFLLGIREKIDEMEEQALENGGKHLIRNVFSLKKRISDLYRLLIEEKDFMLDVDKSVIPFIRLDQKSKPIVDEAIEIIDRELDFMDSYTRTLDSILTLQDLASIHKVESSINYLTIVLVIGTAILIIFELLNVLELA